jgi:hypothetical protein
MVPAWCALISDEPPIPARICICQCVSCLEPLIAPRQLQPDASARAAVGETRIKADRLTARRASYVIESAHEEPQGRSVIKQTFALFRRFWPQLACLYLLEHTLHPWLLRLSVEIGFINRLLGLSALAVLVLLKLVVLVWMFHVVRPGLTSPAALDSDPGAATSTQRFTSVLAVVLVPFFAYYAAWGLLGDVIRDYSLLGLRLDPFGEHGPLLRAGDSQWLLLIVAISWLLRMKCEDQLRQRPGLSWRLAATVLSANWVFIGLYALGTYKETIAAWFARLPIAATLMQVWSSLEISAPTIPLPGFVPSWSAVFDGGRDLFFYALLPLVWFALAAMIYRSKSATNQSKGRFIVERMEGRYASFPAPVRNVFDRLIGGYRKRYVPVARSVELTLTSGLGFLLLFILSYRLLTWGSAWLWILAKQLIGPYPLDVWYVFADVLGIVIGNPLGPERGILFEPLRICLLAAAFDRALAAHQGLTSQTVTAPAVGNAGTAAAPSG